MHRRPSKFFLRSSRPHRGLPTPLPFFPEDDLESDEDESSEGVEPAPPSPENLKREEELRKEMEDSEVYFFGTQNTQS